MISSFSGALPTNASEPGAPGPTAGVTREADPSTMDDYINMLDFSANTRWAGRLWSDKSVFAYGYKDDGDRQTLWNADDNTLTLTPELDGVNGEISLNDDFMHVYSVLGSSLKVEEKTPLDVMFVLDVSGSMGRDSSGKVVQSADKFNTSAIFKTVDSINSAIKQLLEESPDSRFGIAIYGATAAVLVPLDHYTQSGGAPFLTATYDDVYGTDQGLHYNLTATVQTKDGRKIYCANNAGKTSNETHGANGDGNRLINGTGGQTTGEGSEEDPYCVGHITNPQAGLAAAMNQFIVHDERTWQTDDGRTFLRIPALIHLTDGQASDIAWIQPEKSTADDANAWEQGVSNWNNVNWNYDLAYNSTNALEGNNKWNASQLTGEGDASPVIFQTLMTAAYYKSAVDAFYNQDKNVTDSSGNPASLTCYSVYASSDGKGYSSLGDGQVKATIDAILGPEEYFHSYAEDPSAGQNFINNAYALFKTWTAGDEVTNVFTEKTTSSTKSSNDITITLCADKSQAESGRYSEQDWNSAITADVIEENINYVPSGNFFQTSAQELSGIFTNIIAELTGAIFSPVGGMNDLGVEDAITYTDPVGKYMDVKDVKNLALFGNLYDIAKYAVYDYQWNHQYMTNLGEESGSEPLPEGWYLGTPTENNDGVQWGGEALDTPPGGLTAEQAWAAGWVFRINYNSAAKLIPTLNTINSEEDTNDKNIAKMRKTEYTFYRIDIDKKDLDCLHMNPAYLKEDPTEEDALNSGDPGVYALSDLQIWVEDSGDYNDPNVEGTLSDSNFDEALWVNIPVNMLPLRKIAINAKSDVLTYTSNQVAASPAYKASFPLRVFYTVGISDDALENSNRINIAGAISAEYIQQNKVDDTTASDVRGIPQGNLEFFSNWYNPLNRYGDYATTKEDYTYGDPVTSFSPSSGNRYYAFEKALPLYNTAYVWIPDAPKENADATYTQSEGNWRRVEIGEDIGESEDAYAFDATKFGGKLIAQDLEAADDQGSPQSRQAAVWKALADRDIIGVHDGDIILMKNHRLANVDKPDTDEDDPFKSESYYFLPIDYYELENGTATWTQYVITRKGSEFGSAYRAAGITNGDMLCWHDVSGKNTQDYPYLSYSETSQAGTPDPTRGRQYIGAPLGKDGYYNGCDKNSHAVPEEANGSYSDANVNSDWKTIYESGQWVVCAKPGGLRVGDLAQNIQNKGGNYSNEEEAAQIKEYITERYKGDEAATALNWGYYENNVTRTANNYYVPTISATSDIGNADIKVNVYLGNNGRLYAMDTTLLVTKLVDVPEGFQLSDAAKNEEFNFQLFLKDVTGKMDAVVIQWNEDTQSWQRQFHYIDLELDSQLFLQSSDGSKATVDKDGCRIIDSSDGSSFSYAENCKSFGGVMHEAGDTYEGEVYYVYIGRNRGDTDVGVADTAFRVYHNEEMQDGSGAVDESDVVVTGEKGKSGTFYAASVWLVSRKIFEEKWEGENFVADTGFDIQGRSDLYSIQINGGTFELLSIDPNFSDTTAISFKTPYRTVSAYWTKQVEFGKNTNKNDDLPAEPEELTEEGLYDEIIPVGDRPDYFAGLDNEAIAKNTAEFTLKHGQALLFSGISSSTVYRATEKLTKEQLAAGYTLKEVGHNQQVGSVSTYRPGAQKIPVYIDPGATYGKYGGKYADGSFVYPEAYSDRPTENHLMWALDQEGKKNTTVEPTEEPFHHTNAVMWEYYATMDAGANGDNHHQPAGYFDAGRYGTSPFYLWNADKGTSETIPVAGGSLRHNVLDNPSCKPLDEGGCDEEIMDAEGNVTGYRHYMFYEGRMVDQHYEGEGSGYIRNIGRYLVSPTVHFSVSGEKQPDAIKDPGSVESNTDYTGVYSVFGNTGTYEESANFVNTVDPEMLVITKQVVDESGNVVYNPPRTEFEFTLTLTDIKNAAMKDADDILYYWKGNKDLKSSSATWTDNATGKTYNMPSIAPNLDKYPEYILADDAAAREDNMYLEPLKPNDGASNIYTITLKANEAVVIYGLAAEMNYNVTESRVDDYPAVSPNEPHDNPDAPENYTQSGTIEHNKETYAAPTPSETKNRRDFYNQMFTGVLTIEKRIMDDDCWDVDKTFEFTVELTAETGKFLDSSSFTVAQITKKKNGTETEKTLEGVRWAETRDVDGNVTKVTAIFKLKHGERIVIDSIPYGTNYRVAETDRDGYNLEHVADNPDDESDADGRHLEIDRTDNSVSGTVTKDDAEAYLLFNNAQPPILPLTGGPGVWMFYGIGAAVLFAAIMVLAGCRRKPGAHVR